MPLAHLIPWRIRNAFTVRKQARVFERTVADFVRDPRGHLDDRTLQRLHYGWGNAAWSADTSLLQSVGQAIAETEGPILECGSGLTTVLMSALTRSSGREVWSLEHHPEWHARVAKSLGHVGLEPKHVLAPLRSYGDFDWYDVDGLDLPEEFGLVLCDGPPSETPGGRSGLLEVLGENLADGCVVFVDDWQREDEQRMVRDWRVKFGERFAVEDEHETYCTCRYRRGVS